MLTFLAIFAQAGSTDPISGGAGWVGAGLLGLVLGWLLLKHLPDKDRQLREMIDSRDKLALALQDSYIKVLREINLQMKESLKESMADMAKHCEREVAIISDKLGGYIQRLIEVIDHNRQVKP